MFGISQLTNPLLIFGEKLATVDVWWFHSNVHCEMYEEFRTFMTAAKAEYNKAVPHQVKSLFQEFTNHKKIGDELRRYCPVGNRSYGGRKLILITNMGDNAKSGTQNLKLANEGFNRESIMSIVFTRSPAFVETANNLGAFAYCTEASMLIEVLHEYTSMLLTNLGKA